MDEPLVLRTHTRLWQVEKKLYKLYDYTLPMPISLRMMGAFTLAIMIWFPIMVLLNIPFAPPFGHLIWIAPPAGFTWFANKPVAEGKRLGELVWANVHYYLFQHRRYADGRPDFTPDRMYVHGDIWTPTPKPSKDAGASGARGRGKSRRRGGKKAR